MGDAITGLAAFSGAAFAVAANLMARLRAASSPRQGKSLHASNSPAPDTLLETVFENIPHGLCMFDAEGRVIVRNRHFSEMYSLTPAQTRPGVTMQAILEARIDAGSIPDDVANYIASSLEQASRREASHCVSELRSGDIFAISRQPLPDGGLIEIHQNITDVRLTEAWADAARQELIEKQYAIDQAVIVAITDVKGRITYANDNFCLISGYPRDELLGQDHRILNSGSHSKAFFRDMYRQIAKGQVWRGELCNRAKDGSLYWVDTVIAPQLGPSGKPVAFMAIRIDITARKLAEQQVMYAARHDALTGIANRAVLYEKMVEASANLRNFGQPFAIFMLDLDGFKYVNDTLGHAGGDNLLKELARRLESSLRETEMVARLGGDEFAIIQRSQTNQREEAIALAIKVLDIVAKPFDLDGHNVSIGTSIGIALAPESGREPGDLLKKADLALYRVKSEGRNSFTFFDEALSKDTMSRLQLLSDMRLALARDEFELHYQPVFDARTCRPCAVETLVRWRHPTEGLLSPDRFIWLAEETGLMEPLGQWILAKACRDAMAFPPHIKVAVNLSAAQFRTGLLLDVILCALVESGLPPDRLELEITESLLLQNRESYGQTIRQLKNIGVTIVLDDFGTGYASLSYLTMFPFDRIKIDRSFTQGLSSRVDCAAVVTSVLTLARGLDIAVTAEGVETSQQYELLRAAGVDHVQGFLFGRPVPIAELNFTNLELKARRSQAA
ncbi:MAG TPA: EAL domain-containing protein [Xanthobacteraceae bacterium]|nr:EAL domain-containing protein [Xanthobacteraceae bacterium]